MYLSYVSAHAHDSSNHSYVSMNMDSINDRELFSLLHPDIYHSFFDDGVYESTAPLLDRNNEDSFVDNLMLGVQLADVSTRCSSHPQGKSEARCEIDGNL